MKFWTSKDLLLINPDLMSFECMDILDIMGRTLLAYQVNRDSIKKIIDDYLVRDRRK
jgi:hypothetical protein